MADETTIKSRMNQLADRYADVLLLKNSPEKDSEIAVLKAQLDALQTDDPFNQAPTISNVAQAVGTRIIKSGADIVDSTVNVLANTIPFMTGMNEKTQSMGETVDARNARGEKIPYRINVPKIADFNFMQNLPSSQDILGEGKAANTIDYGVDATLLAGPTGKGIAMLGGRLIKAKPSLEKILYPLTEFNRKRDLSLGAVSGMAEGYYADDEGGSTVAAFVAPLLTQLSVDSAKGVLKKFNFLNSKSGLDGIPEKMAGGILYDTLQRSGYDIDEAMKIYKELGPEGWPADISDAFRISLRSLRDDANVQGSIERQTKARIEGDPKDVANTGQVGRIGRDINNQLGTLNATEYLQKLEVDNRPEFNALYKEVRESSPDFSMNRLDNESQEAIRDNNNLALLLKQGPGGVPVEVSGLPKEIIERMNDPATQQAVRAVHVDRMNANRGQPYDNAFDFINAVSVKMNEMAAGKLKTLDSSQSSSESNAILQAKTNFMEAADSFLPGFKDARNKFAGFAKLRNTVELGQNFLNPRKSGSVDDLRLQVQAMPEHELEAFKLGARESLMELVLSAPLNSNSASKIIRTPANIQRLSILFPEKENLDIFIDGMAREAEFVRTRNMVSGNSQTSTFQQGIAQMNESVKRVADIAMDPSGVSQLRLVTQLITTLSGGATDAQIKEAKVLVADILMNSEIPVDRVRRLLTNGQEKEAIKVVPFFVYAKGTMPKRISNAIRSMSGGELASYMVAQRDQAEANERQEATLNNPALNEMAGRTSF